ncbi:MAG: hypothetical protein AAFX44_08085 [Pseudomonadota bacterium]
MIRAVLVCCLVVLPVAADAFEVWDGPPVSYSKAGTDNPNDPAFQDELTTNVRITRGFQGGIYNVAQESFFSQTTSPADTEWAFSGLNGSPSGSAFSATNCANSPGLCDFRNWFDAQGENSMGENLVGRPAVVHLITDDIYLDLTFSEFTNVNLGARVAYERASPSSSVPVPLPAWAVMLIALLIVWVGGRTIRRNT